MSTTPTPAFEVHPYTITALVGLLASKSTAGLNVVEQKSHRTYFEQYFSDIGAQTIVVENEYLDHDYLEDYAEYYVRCFEPYGRMCVRLHFFRSTFSESDFSSLLQGQGASLSADSLQSEYLGFIVVKPLPRTVIGRTCLLTYPTEGTDRFFPITRLYEISLFGLRLHVTSLAFQEQDSVAAACATSALWSAFHGTGKLFQHPIPSPIEITKAATESSVTISRTLPNKGLTPEQMANAIRSVSLEPLTISVTDEIFQQKALCYAYLRGRIPLMMLHRLFETSPTPRSIDLHAVTVTGYHLGLPVAEPLLPTGFLLHATRIDKIYAHDDQVGPFARMEFDGVRVSVDATTTVSSLSTTYGQGMFTARAVPLFLLIPLYNKVRITFETILASVVPFDAFLDAIRVQTNIIPSRLEWDVHLTSVNDFKSDILTNGVLGGVELETVLTQHMPRFMWRATARSQDDYVFDLLFDATGIESARLPVSIIEYQLGFSALVRMLVAAFGVSATIDRPSYDAIIDHFR